MYLLHFFYSKYSQVRPTGIDLSINYFFLCITDFYQNRGILNHNVNTEYIFNVVSIITTTDTLVGIL